MIPAVLLIALASGLAVSFGPTAVNVPVAHVTFEGGAAAPDGVYSVLADDGTSAWLLACVPKALAVRVPSAKIAAIQVVGYGPPATPAPWTAVPGVGFAQRCP